MTGAAKQMPVPKQTLGHADAHAATGRHVLLAAIAVSTSGPPVACTATTSCRRSMTYGIHKCEDDGIPWRDIETRISERLSGITRAQGVDPFHRQRPPARTE